MLRWKFAGGHVYFACSGSLTATIGFQDGSAEDFEIPSEDDAVLRVWRWTCARCDKPLAEIKLAAKNNAALVYAITLEEPVAETMLILPEQVKAFHGFSGPRLVPRYENGVIEMTHGAIPCPWSGGNLLLKEPLKLPVSWTNAWFVMEVNKRKNRYGANAAAPSIQVAIEGRYVTPKVDDRLTDFGAADDDSTTWETLYVPINTAKLKDRTIQKIAFQYKTLRSSDPSALAFRNFRLIRGED